MATLLEDKLIEAYEVKKTDINSFIWKGNKTLDNNGKYKQTEKKLTAMTEFEIHECYDHCKTMLFNKDPQNPGRYLVLDLIIDQRERCGAELFLRFLETNKQMSRFSLINSMNDFLANNKEALKGTKVTMDILFSNIPNEFEKVPLNLVMDGCLDRLGVFNKKHITRTFILKQGIWLTPSESKELIEYDSFNNLVDRMGVIRERLGIKEIERLYLNCKGINFTQMRAMLNIKPNKKYMDLTTVQLETLRNRILFNLEELVKNHIESWEIRMGEIEKVVEYKGFKL